MLLKPNIRDARMPHHLNTDEVSEKKSVAARCINTTNNLSVCKITRFLLLLLS